MPVSSRSFGSVARGLAQYPREQQAREQAAGERREKFAYDILKLKYQYDRKAEQARLTLQEDKLLTPDEVFKIGTKVEKLKLKYRDAEMTGKRYGQGRWTQDLIASGVNIARLKSEAERGNEQAVSLVNEMDTYTNTLPDTLVDWMTIAEQQGIGDTKLSTAQKLASGTGWGEKELPQRTMTKEGREGISPMIAQGLSGIPFGSSIARGFEKREPEYGYPEGVVSPKEMEGKYFKEGGEHQVIGAYRKFKGYPTEEGEGKTTVPDLSGLSQGGARTAPTGDIRDKVREFLESKDIEPSDENINIFLKNNPEFE